jgi:Fungal Zn(2)-Cys(6) binuclear cluster domain
MAYPSSQNIDPVLRQNTLTSPAKPRDTFQNGAQAAYSPLQPSPNPSYQGMTPNHQTPSYYSNQQTHDSPEDEQSPSANPSDPNDLKRPRACEACRQLKVKCELDDNNPTGSCKRCAKAGRSCIVTAPSRKRQKKTDSRVAELEKKIDALTASLAARGGGSPEMHEHPMHQAHPPPAPPQRTPVYADQWAAHHQPAPPGQSPPIAAHGVKRKMANEYDYPRFGGELQKPPPSAYQPPKTSAPLYTTMDHSELPRRDESEYPPLDPITHGLLDTHTAKKCFERYMAEMCYHLPIVVFPANTRWEEVRKTKPVLFLSVLAVASGTIRPDIQTRLISEVTRILADRIVYRGEKSLELVQCIQCITTFYQPPERYEELNFNQLIHVAAVMALDLGMGKRFKKGSLALWRSHTENKRPLPDPNSAETRRCWLGCYYMCSK